jgi:peptide deformylase
MRGEPVTSFGRPLHGLLDDLVATMRAAPGVGLAAPQVGEPLAVCVIEVGDRLLELVNPKIVRANGDDRDLEGCLSLPGYYAYVTRREHVWVVAQNRFGARSSPAAPGHGRCSTSGPPRRRSTSTPSTRWTTIAVAQSRPGDDVESAEAATPLA